MFDFVIPRFDSLVPTLGGLTTVRLVLRWGCRIDSKPSTWAHRTAGMLG